MKNGAMAQLKTLKREHVREAIKNLKSIGVPPRHASRQYDLFWWGQPLPQKYIASVATKYATGNQLLPSQFSASQSVPILLALGFDVERREARSNTIKGEIVEDLYHFSREVYEGSVTAKEALSALGINQASAKDCFHDFRQMMRGQVYHRTMNSETTDYFLSQIFADYGAKALGRALDAVDKHLKYYNALGRGNLRGIRTIWRKYKAMPVGASNKHEIDGTYTGASPSFREKPTKTAINLSRAGTKPNAPLSQRDAKFMSDTWGKYGMSDFERLNMDAGNINRALERNLMAYVSGDVTSAKCCFRLTAKARLALEDKEALYFNEAGSQTAHTEGEASDVMRRIFKRSPNARADCLQHYGYKCKVCKFDFERAYGAIGRQFIHVHHRIEISSIGKNYKIDPINDLVPVCPNCHAMLHQKRPAIAVEELEQIVRTPRSRARQK